MVERQAIQRLNREFALLKNANTPYFTARPSESDMLTWHYVIYNLPPESPYSGGQYHGKLIFPREYPLKPPSILMCTLSGRFEVNKRLCLSISDYHPETWNPSWRIETILLGLVSFMLDETDPATAGGITASWSSRRDDALLSFFRNTRNKDFRKHFPDLLNLTLYAPGFGFKSPLGERHSEETLETLGVQADEVENISSLDDLEDLVVKKGGRKHGKTATREREVFKNWLPLIAIGVLLVASIGVRP
jgi:ubiquitin-conjugating enzyme E2 J2